MQQPVAAGDSGSSFVPIFMRPAIDAIRNTFSSEQPLVVQPREVAAPRDRAARNAHRLAGPGLTNNSNPWEGTSFGRIRKEIDYFDREDGRYYNQYDYMAALAMRDDRNRLGEVTEYIQENGVFDPKKYQEAMRAAAAGTIPSELRKRKKQEERERSGGVQERGHGEGWRRQPVVAGGVQERGHGEGWRRQPVVAGGAQERGHGEGWRRQPSEAGGVQERGHGEGWRRQPSEAGGVQERGHGEGWRSDNSISEQSQDAGSVNGTRPIFLR